MTYTPFMRNLDSNIRGKSDMSTQHAVWLYWVPGHAGVHGNEIAEELARDGTALKFVGLEPALGVSRQEGIDVGSLTSIGYGCEVLVTPKDRLDS
jgi:hypothetical protein